MALIRPETKFKNQIVKAVCAEGGYARRLEDQFAVGLPDLILIPKGGPVFFVEAKIIRAGNWGPTIRQRLELDRINATKAAVGCVIGLDGTNTVVLMKPDGSAKLRGDRFDGTHIVDFLLAWKVANVR